ncbi:MAG: hypothetical protein QME52_07570 [Bacteroidota bacterium]|nr:hypothetical protein [Bacteroidota bacterium]
MKRLASLCYVILVVFALSCNSRDPSWTLAIHLGDSKSRIYSILGAPTQDNKEDIQCFQKSGFTLRYDPDGNVSTIIVHGPWNKKHFFTYGNPVFAGLKVTDTIDRFKKKLGTPTMVEHPFPGDPSTGKCTWRLSAYMIEVGYWVSDHLEDEVPVKAGDIVSVEIIRAIGGR